jgi:plasmid stabilization system protein ParE
VRPRLHVEPQAERDAEEAAVWYEDREAGLGAAFLAAFSATLRRILDAPEACAPVRGVDLVPPVRSVRVKPYAYRVVFLERPDQLRVIAVMHVRQRPESLRSRLAEPGV